MHDALRTGRVFIAGRGFNMNQQSNDLTAGRPALNMGEPAHRGGRQIIAKPLMPAALTPPRLQIRSIAVDLIDALVARGGFDGVRDFSHVLPLELVSRLVGLPEEGREDACLVQRLVQHDGQLNHRYDKGVPSRQEARNYIERFQPNDLAPGSWGARALALARIREITDRQAREVIMSYVGPALDTTINATSGAILLFGQNPDQWGLVRADSRLIPAAIEEAIRLETPIRAFNRQVAEGTEMDGVALPKGARVLVVYASFDLRILSGV